MHTFRHNQTTFGNQQHIQFLHIHVLHCKLLHDKGYSESVTVTKNVLTIKTIEKEVI